MTISGREQDPSDDYEFNDPYILPVHLYREPPPSYAEVAARKEQSSPNQEQQLQGETSDAMASDTGANSQIENLPGAPPSYEKIQSLGN